jgi:hypothetical protein
MIRYATLPGGAKISLKTLEAAIKADATGHADPEVRKAVRDWVKKAKARTAQLLAVGTYIDTNKWQRLSAAEKEAIAKPIDLEWSSVKYLFMKIQNEKCAYCERKLASQGDGGAAEHDLEHFRPKSPIKAWNAPKAIDFPTGGPDTGYYCTACKKCNSGFKSNQFPVAGNRLRPPAGPTSPATRAERPFLIYPLGLADDDPEELIRFRGITAHPPAEDPLLDPKARRNLHRNRRARVTIEFFGLNRRDELLWGRAEKLRDLEKALTLINRGTATEKIAAQDDIRRMTDGFSEHTACMRAMLRLYQSDVKIARALFQVIREYLDSKTPKTYFEKAGRFLKASSPG